jgi:hypothetical protein
MENGTYNGKVLSIKIADGGWYIFWTGIRWEMSDELAGTAYYYHTGTGSTPPTGEWTIGSGAANAPTVAHLFAPSESVSDSQSTSNSVSLSESNSTSHSQSAYEA